MRQDKFITIKVVNKGKARLDKLHRFLNGDGLTKVLEDIGDDQIDEHLKRFDYFKVDYKNKPLMGLMESYYKWKVWFTGLSGQNIGILTGKMRAMTFSRVKDKTLYIENFVKNDKGKPYAHHFQKSRPIFGFSKAGLKRAKKICKEALKNI